MTSNLVAIEQIGRVGTIRLNRPAQLNALCDELMDALGAALLAFERSADIGCIVLLGSDKAFAAGADVAAMASMSYTDVVKTGLISRNWETITKIRKPVVAGVAGYAVGGGCELAMMCDFIIAADNAKFGQPEIRLGVIPGAGGTQRLPRAVSKALAMDMILTGRTLGADDALQAGLISRVVPLERLEEEVLGAAATIASMSLPVAIAAKEAINRAFEGSLAEGVLFERRNFHALFAIADRREGMDAFLEKRKPQFKHE